MNGTGQEKRCRWHWAWILMIAAAVVGCSQDPEKAGMDPNQPSAITAITSADQLATALATAGTKLVIVEFYADWCKPCQELRPIYERLARKYENRILPTKVNVDYVKALAQKFRVVGIPNVVYIKNGNVVEEFKGLRSASTYENAILKHMDPS